MPNTSDVTLTFRVDAEAMAAAQEYIDMLTVAAQRLNESLDGVLTRLQQIDTACRALQQVDSAVPAAMSATVQQAGPPDA